MTLATPIAKPVQALTAFGRMLAEIQFYLYFRKRNNNIEELLRSLRSLTIYPSKAVFTI
jgi:hypothetical protein